MSNTIKCLDLIVEFMNHRSERNYMVQHGSNSFTDNKVDNIIKQLKALPDNETITSIIKIKDQINYSSIYLLEFVLSRWKENIEHYLHYELLTRAQHSSLLLAQNINYYRIGDKIYVDVIKKIEGSDVTITCELRFERMPAKNAITFDLSAQEVSNILGTPVFELNTTESKVLIKEMLQYKRKDDYNKDCFANNMNIVIVRNKILEYFNRNHQYSINYLLLNNVFQQNFTAANVQNKYNESIILFLDTDKNGSIHFNPVQYSFNANDEYFVEDFVKSTEKETSAYYCLLSKDGIKTIEFISESESDIFVIENDNGDIEFLDKKPKNKDYMKFSKNNQLGSTKYKVVYSENNYDYSV